MTLKNLFIIATSAWALSACSNNSTGLIEARQRLQAPQGKQDLGVVLEDAKPEQVEAILQNHPEAQVRVVDPKSGLYEIFGVDHEIVQKEYSGFSVDNQFFSFRNPEHSVLMAVTPPPGFKIGKLKPCAPAVGDGPTAVLTVEKPTDLTLGKTIDVGTKIQLSGKKSTAPEGNKDPLTTAIVVVLPESVENNQTVLDADSVTLETKALGVYQVFLVVQDSNNQCSIDAFRFLASANRPYDVKAARDLRLDVANEFRHLNLISSQESWSVSRGDGVTIAVIDTGVNYNHPSLAGRMAENDKEIPGNGIDDDKDGLVDNFIGYDFVNHDGFPYDDDGHGTHVAGLAAARQFGQAQGAKIMALKALTSIGGDAASITAAINYAVEHGAKIINLSLGIESPFPHPLLVKAANNAESKGVLLVVAAGNGDPNTGLGFSIDDRPVFPASLQNSNIVSVASFDSEDELSIYSNFGPHSVHVVAPGGGAGGQMRSAAHENPDGKIFAEMAGTSMAAPIVSGVAAQVWSKSPQLTAVELKKILISSGREVPSLKNATVSGRHLNALTAVTAINKQNILY